MAADTLKQLTGGQAPFGHGRMPCVRIWEPGKGECVRTLAMPNTEMRKIAWSSDGRWLAASGGNGMVRIWDAATFELARTIEAHSSDARAIAFSPDGKRLASAGRDGSTRLWALELQTRNPDMDVPKPKPGHARNP